MSSHYLSFGAEWHGGRVTRVGHNIYIYIYIYIYGKYLVYILDILNAVNVHNQCLFSVYSNPNAAKEQ